MKKRHYGLASAILILILCFSCTGLSGRPSGPDKSLFLDRIRESAHAQSSDMVSFLSKTIQYASVEEFGYELTPETRELMSFVLKTGKEMGFDARLEANGLVGVLEYGQGEESVGVLIHLDVVPVTKEEEPQWEHPPFAGLVTDTQVWGRGAQDNKGALTSVLWGAKLLIDNQVSFKRKLRIILGTKEEKSFEALITYFKEFPQEKFGPTFGFVPDGAFISQGEKGIADLNFLFPTPRSTVSTRRDTIVDWRGGSAVNTVPDFSFAVIKSRDPEAARKELLDVIDAVTRELKSGKSDHFYGVKESVDADINLMDYKTFVAAYSPQGMTPGDLVLFSKGVSAHGSAPWLGRNAIVEVALAGSRMGHLTDNGYKRAFEFVATTIGLSTDGSGLGIPFITSLDLPPVPPPLVPLSYYGTSTNLGLVQSTGDDQVRLSVDFRTGFKNTSQQILDHCVASAARFQGTAAYVDGVGSHYEPFYHTRDNPLLKLVIDSYKAVFPDYPAYTPYVFLTPATTYLKLVSNFVNFGPVDLYPDFTANYFHEKNERTTIKSLVNNAILYAYTLQTMIQMEHAPAVKAAP